MLYLTCTMISSVDLAHYGVSRAKDWVSVDCGTIHFMFCITISFFRKFIKATELDVSKFTFMSMHSFPNSCKFVCFILSFTFF